MDGGGYFNMCGYGIIGVMIVVIEIGVVLVVEFVIYVVMEVLVGIIRGDVIVVDGKVKEVLFLNVLVFLYKEGVEVDLLGVGIVKFDILFGGSFFVIIYVS